MVKVTADSGSDIPALFLTSLDINIIPIEVSFGEEIFLDTMEDGHQQFIEKLKHSPYLPHTSQPSPYRYRAFFEEALASGEDVLFFSVSSGFSGCYTTACLVAQEINDPRLHVIDSKSATIGIGLQVIKAAQMAKEGKTVADILRVVSVMQNNMISYILVNTVDFLHKGGRIRFSEKILANILNIKPVISVLPDGTAQAIHKVRGFKKGLQYIVSQVAAISRDYTHELLAFGYCGDESLKGVLENLLRKEVKLGKTFDFAAGPCIATHVGPGTVAVFFCRPGVLEHLA